MNLGKSLALLSATPTIPGHSRLHLGPTGMEGWKEAVQELPPHHPLPEPTCRRLCSGSWWGSSWSCRTEGHPPSKACMALSMEGGVQDGLG